MRIIDGIKGGLVIVIDWPRQDKTVYQGFDVKAVWPDAEWQAEESDTKRSISKITPKETDKIKFNSIKVMNGLVSISELEQVLKYKSNLEDLNRLIYLKFTDFESSDLDVTKKQFNFLGYDYGNYISEDNFYSFIYHEIIGGSREELKDFAKYLNKNLLFPSLASIPVLEKKIIELRAKGEYLEDEREGEEFQPIAVYSYKESN